ncbi:MAG: 50S ribosomal protein L35 [Myxococcales bacterium]|nr:50S ribosomal protein L35 [Myxococcales bacterium]
MAKKIKVKTNRAAAKRFRLTGNGHVKRKKSGHSHGMGNKSRKRNNRLRKAGLVHADRERRVKMLLPYA